MFISSVFVKTQTDYYFTGIRSRSFLLRVRNSDRRVRVLLRAHFPDHQTPQQGGPKTWTRRSQSIYYDSWPIPWWKHAADSAAGDWSIRWHWQEVVSYWDQCSKDHDRHHRLLHSILDCYWSCQVISNSWGKYTLQHHTTLIFICMYDLVLFPSFATDCNYDFSAERCNFGSCHKMCFCRRRLWHVCIVTKRLRLWSRGFHCSVK